MRNTDPSRATVELVRERDQHRCARCGSGRGLSTQHRIARGMGGTRWQGINLPSNLLTLCGSGTTGCHGYVEHHPLIAQAHGWSVWQTDAPSAAPMWTWHGWLLLDTEGGTERLTDHPGVAGCSCGCQPRELSTAVWL